MTDAGAPPAERAAAATPSRSRVDRRLLGLAGALVALLLLNVALTPNFLDIRTLAVNVSQVSTIAIVALGMTLVIASGGVGNLEHLADGIQNGGADAVLAASIFHYGEYTVQQAKSHMAARGIPVRL